jgi:NTP pyrophosphatase (non-canonical NTP hydrolase)
MSIGAYQQEVGRWVDEQFGDDDPKELAALVLVEEVGEMCRAIVKSAQNIRGGPERWDPEIRREAGDVLITLFSLAHQFDFDLEGAFAEKWAEVGARVVASPEEQAR